MKAATAATALVFVLGAGALAQQQSAPPPAPATNSGMAGPMTSAPPMEGFAKACGADVQKICPAAQTPMDRRVCITSNEDKVSADCETFLANRRALRQQRQEQTPPQPPGGE